MSKNKSQNRKNKNAKNAKNEKSYSNVPDILGFTEIDGVIWKVIITPTSIIAESYLCVSEITVAVAMMIRDGVPLNEVLDAVTEVITDMQPGIKKAFDAQAS